MNISKPCLTKEELIKNLKVLSVSEIACFMGVSRQWINKLIKKYEIKREFK